MAIYMIMKKKGSRVEKVEVVLFNQRGTAIALLWTEWNHNGSGSGSGSGQNWMRL